MRYEDFHLKSDPFQPVFTESMVASLDKLLVGRKKEIDNIKDWVASGNSIFVHGIFGVGKTIMLRRVLQELYAEGFFTVYVNGYFDQSLEKNILRNLLDRIIFEQFEGIDYEELSQIYQLVIGEKLSLKATTKVGMAKLFNLSYDNEVLRERGLNLNHFINTYLDKIKKSGRQVCIAIDGLDFDLKLEEIPKLVMELRKNYIEQDISIVIAGHPMGVMSGFGSYSDILLPVITPILNEEHMKLMIKRYLEWQRFEGFDNALGEYYPFEEEVVDFVCSVIFKLKLSTRYLHNTCKMILNHHKLNDIPQITMKSLKTYWESIISASINVLKPEDMEVYKIIFEDGGILEPENHRLCEALGDTFSEYDDIINRVLPLFKENILIQYESRFEINPIFKEDFIKSFIG